MTYQLAETRFVECNLGSVKFTPESLREESRKAITSLHMIVETYSDVFLVEYKVKKATEYLETHCRNTFHLKEKKYHLSDTQIAFLIVLFGVDAIDQLYTQNKITFATPKTA